MTCHGGQGLSYIIEIVIIGVMSQHGYIMSLLLFLILLTFDSVISLFKYLPFTLEINPTWVPNHTLDDILFHVITDKGKAVDEAWPSRAS